MIKEGGGGLQCQISSLEYLSKKELYRKSVTENTTVNVWCDNVAHNYQLISVSLRVIDVTRKSREKLLRWFRHVERKRYSQNIGKLKVEGNRVGGRPKKKCKVVIREDMRACGRC